MAAAGPVDRRPARAPLTADGQGLPGAIRNAGAEVPLADLQRLAAAMDGGERLSLTLRFEDGSARLDAASETGPADLGRTIATRALDGWQVILAGFRDGSGAAATNLALSRDRAAAARAALARRRPELSADELPSVEAWGKAWGEARPMACNTTASGRPITRRVEVWLRPLPDWDRPRPEPGATGP